MTKVTIQDLLDEVGAGRLLMGMISDPVVIQKVKRIALRPISIKQQKMYQFSEHYKDKIMHHNATFEECAGLILECLSNQFKQGMFSTESADYHVLVNKKKQLTVLKKPPTHQCGDIEHNRKKNYVLEEGVPVPFLVDLGVMTSEGKVIAKKYDKFRQINRFLEMVRDIFPHLPRGRPIEIIDFGCGKAYLTFALYHYLHVIEKRTVNIVGLDLKQEVIEHCQAVADRLGYESLKFSVGDINQHNPTGKVDLVISLHACDTATDAALEKGVRWEAEVILCAPCCQHELYGQVKSDFLAPLLRYGILKERFAALATDAARAEILTVLGYDVQILEFIDLEHTPKNLLIRAVKDISKQKQQHAKARYQRFKQALNIQPSLEKRFQSELNFSNENY